MAWAVAYIDPKDGTEKFRRCENESHANAVLAGWPDRYQPARIVQV